MKYNQEPRYRDDSDQEIILVDKDTEEFKSFWDIESMYFSYSRVFFSNKKTYSIEEIKEALKNPKLLEFCRKRNLKPVVVTINRTIRFLTF